MTSVLTARVRTEERALTHLADTVANVAMVTVEGTVI